jgi:hypothetical protein
MTTYIVDRVCLRVCHFAYFYYTVIIFLFLTYRRSTPPLSLISGRTDKNLCRCFGAPACRISLIPYQYKYKYK